MPEQVGVSLEFIKGNEKALDDALTKVKEIEKAGAGIELNFKVTEVQNTQLEKLNKNMSAFNKIMKDIKLDNNAIEKVNKMSEVIGKAIGNFSKVDTTSGNMTTTIKGYSDLINVFKKLNTQDFDASKLLHNTKSLQQALNILNGADININILSTTKGLSGLISSMNKLSRVNLDGDLIAKNLKSIMGALNSLNGTSVNPQVIRQLRELSEINLGGLLGGGNGQGGLSTARTGLIYSAMNTAMMYSRLLFQNFSDFEHTLLNISVAGEISIEGLSKVRDEIYRMSVTAGVSANEIAKSMDEVIKTGYDLKDSMFIVQEAVKLSVSTGDSLQASALALSKTMLTFQMEAGNATDVINMMQSVANKTPASMSSIQEALKQSNSVFANYVNYTTKTGRVLEDYQKELLQTQLSLVGGLSVAGRKGEQIGTSLRALATKISAMEKTGKELFDTQMKMTNGYVILDKATNEYRITNEKTAESFLLTSDYLKSLAEEDLTKTIDLMSELVINGNLSATSLNKIFTIQHGGYLANAFYQINGNLDEFNKKMSTGTTAQENFDKVQNSFIKSWDRLKNALLGVNGVFADFANTAGKPIVDLFGGIASGISYINQRGGVTKALFGELSAMLIATSLSFRYMSKEGQGLKSFLLTSLVPSINATSGAVKFLSWNINTLSKPAVILGAFAVIEGLMIAYNTWVQETEKNIAESLDKLEKMKKIQSELSDIRKQYNIMMNQRLTFVDKDNLDDIKKLDRYMMEAISSFNGLDSANTAITTLNTSLIGLNGTIRELSKNKLTRTQLVPEIGLEKRVKNRISELDMQKSEGGMNWDIIEKEKQPYKTILEDSAKNILAKRDEAEAFKKINEYIYLERDGLAGVSEKLESIGYTHEYILDLYQRANSMRNESLKNENAIIEAMQKRNELVKSQYDTIVEGIANYSFQLQKTSIADIKFPTMEGFKDKLKSFGFEQYAKEVDNYSSTFDKMYTNSDKVDLLKNKFMNFISTQEGLKSMRKNLEENNKIINITFGESISRYEKITGATRTNIEEKMKEAKAGSTTYKILKEQETAYKELDMANIKNKKSLEYLAYAEKQNKDNLNVVNTQYEKLELVNSTYDEQLKLLSKINASKLEAIKIDREIYDMQYINKQSQLSYNIKIQEKTLQEEGLSNSGKYLNINKKYVLSLEEAIKSYEGIAKLSESQIKAHNILLDFKNSMNELDLLNLDTLQKKLELNKQEYEIKNGIIKDYSDMLFGDNYSVELQQNKVENLKKERDTKTDIYEIMSLSVEISKNELEISNKKLEKEKKIAELKRDIAKYSERDISTKGMGDIAKISTEYKSKRADISKEIDKYYSDMLAIKLQQPTSNKDITNTITALTKEKTTLEGKQNISSIGDIEKRQNSERIKDLTSQIVLFEKYNNGQITENELIEENIKYLEARKGYEKSNSDYVKTRTEETEKEILAREKLLEINEKIAENNRQLASYANYDVLESILNSKEQKPLDLSKYNEAISISQKKIDNFEKSHNIRTEEEREKAKNDYSEYAGLIANKQDKELQKEKEIIDYKIEKYRIELEGISKAISLIDTISKGQSPKIDTAGAMEKLPTSILKMQEGKALNGKDYMNLTVATAGIITNAFNSAYESQSKAIEYELSALDIRKQLAQSDEERQKIDIEILEKQKQQIDLQFKQATQTAGVTGVAGSALGGAVSGAMAGASLGSVVPVVGTAMGAVAGGLLGGISGILGGNESKKQAEQQKAQLEAQYKANQILQNLLKLQENSNKLISDAISATNKGMTFALKDSLKDLMLNSDLFNKGTTELFPSIGALKINAQLLGVTAGKDSYSTEKKLESALNQKYSNMIQTPFEHLASGNSILSIESISQIRKNIREFQDMYMKLQTGQSYVDSAMFKNLNNLNKYLDSMQLVIAKGAEFNSSYFGYTVEVKKDEGFITDIVKGEWEKRSELLDDFVSSSLGKFNTISKSVSTIVMSGYADTIIRNNYSISKSMASLEADMGDYIGLISGTYVGKYAGIDNKTAQSMVIKNMVEDTKYMNVIQKGLNYEVQMFANSWISAGGAISDVIDMMPEFSKNFQSAVQNSISDTSYIDRFNNIGNAISNSIEKQMEKNLFDKYFAENFMQTNALLTSIMNGAEVKLSDVMNLRSGIEVASAKMETESLKVKSILDTLKMSDIEYTAQNTQVQYTTGSTSTNNYYVNNNVALNVGNMITMSKQDKDTLAYELADSFIGAIDSKYGKNIIE